MFQSRKYFKADLCLRPPLFFDVSAGQVCSSSLVQVTDERRFVKGNGLSLSFRRKSVDRFIRRE